MNRRLTSVRLHTTWLAGLVRRRTGRVAATVTGIGLAVALLASLGAFLSASKATMTRRAIDMVAVDWQVETQPGADVAQVRSHLHDLDRAPSSRQWRACRAYDRSTE